MSAPLVIYAGPFAFPHGGAAARRVLGNALSLRAAGCNVEVWSGQHGAADPGRRDAAGRPRRDAAGHRAAIPVRSLGERRGEAMPRLLRHAASAGMGRGLVRALDAEARPIRAVVLYSGYTPYLGRLLAWSRRSGVPVAFDAVEWYDPPRRARWLCDPYYWNTEYAMRRLAPACRNAIVISRHLERHFRQAGCRTVRVPPTLDIAKVEADTAPRAADRPLLLAFAGTPGHKERLGALLAAIDRLGSEATRLRVAIAGVGEPELLALSDVAGAGVTRLPAGVAALGRMPHAEALALVRQADASVLLRPRARFSAAGFPTKAVESLAAGTPVFGNLTSDLGEHLRDGLNAVIVGAATVDAVTDGLRRLLALPRAALDAMRRAARAEAERAFDYRAHTAALGGFVHSLRQGRP